MGRIGAVLVGLAALVAVGCAGTESEEPEPTPEPTVEPRTIEELEQALPTDDQLPDGVSDVRRCPGGDNCFSTGDGDTGVVFAAPAPEGLEPSEAEAREQRPPGTDWTHLRVVDLPDAATLEERVAELRSELGELDGEFDTEAERVGEGFAPGQKGTGRLDEQEVAGWAGLQHTSTVVLSGLEDEPMGERTDATVLLWSGTMLVEARTYLSEGYTEAAAEDLVRTLVNDYLDRLDAL